MASTVIVASYRYQTLGLCLSACFANVSHTAWLEVKKKRKNNSNSMEPQSLTNIRSVPATPSLPWALGNMSAYLLFRSRFSSIVHCVLWMSAKVIFFQCWFSLLMLCVCALMVCLWSSSEWLPCRATVQALLPQRIKPERRAHRENSSSEDQGEDKRVLQLNHYLITEFNRRQNSVWHMQCI